MRFLMAMIVVGCSGDSTLTQSSIGGRASGGGASSTGDPAAGEVSDGAGEGEGEGGPAEGEGEGGVASGEGEGEAAAPPAEGEGEGAVAAPGGPACVRREREAEDVCAQPCAPGCPEGQACLTFPAGKLCLPAGDRLDGAVCTSPTDCEGGLCIWSGGGARPLQLRVSVAGGGRRRRVRRRAILSALPDPRGRPPLLRHRRSADGGGVPAAGGALRGGVLPGGRPGGLLHRVVRSLRARRVPRGLGLPPLRRGPPVLRSPADRGRMLTPPFHRRPAARRSGMARPSTPSGAP